MIKHLKSKNIKSYNGLNMFIYQGQKAFYIWNKINPEVDECVNKIVGVKIKNESSYHRLNFFWQIYSGKISITKVISNI